jgi:hypothetical protein
MPAYVIPAVDTDYFGGLPPGLAFNTTPDMYSFVPYRLPEFGTMLQQELVARLLGAWIHHGTWSSMHTLGLYLTTTREHSLRRRDDRDPDLPDSVLDFLQPTALFQPTIHDFVLAGILGADSDDPFDTLVWPTKKFIRLLDEHQSRMT